MGHLTLLLLWVSFTLVYRSISFDSSINNQKKQSLNNATDFQPHDTIFSYGFFSLVYEYTLTTINIFRKVSDFCASS